MLRLSSVFGTGVLGKFYTRALQELKVWLIRLSEVVRCLAELRLGAGPQHRVPGQPRGLAQEQLRPLIMHREWVFSGGNNPEGVDDMMI